MRKIRVVVVDDHEAVLEGVRSRLASEVDIEVVGEAENGIRALELVDQLQPDVLLLDMNLQSKGDLDGVDVIRQLRERQSPVSILAISHTASHHYVFDVLALEVSGYVLKSEPLSHVVEGIRRVHKGQGWWYSEGVQARLLEFSRGRAKRICILSDREIEVLTLVAHGRSNKEIAQSLRCSASTIKHHVENITRKLKVQGRGQAAAWAWENGYADLA